MPHTRSAKLAGWQIWLLTVSGGGLWLSGLAWVLLHYFGQVSGDFGPETNPLEPWLLRLHGFAVIPALLGFGGMMVVHIPKGWKSKRQRIAGLALTAISSVLILSGYLLYYVGVEVVRDWASLIHWAIGLTLPAAFVWHYLGRSAAKTKARVKAAGC